MKKRNIIIILLVVLVSCYVLGPILAGAFRVGDRRGPIFYPAAFHEVLYIIAYESSHNGKPRMPLDNWMYRRPLFYGLPRRLRSREERQEYLDMIRRNESPILERYEALNREVDSRNQK